MKALIVCFFLFFSTSACALNSDCQTHEFCATDTICQCMVPAESAYDRKFYLDFNPVTKGHTYQCQLSDTLSALLVLSNESTFPKGSTYQGLADVTHFPASFQLDTTAMENATDTMTIKYLAPAADMPTDITMSCVMMS